MNERSKRALSISLVVAGAFVMAVGAMADMIGIGRTPGFGAIQILMMVVGLMMVIGGLRSLKRR